MEHDPDRPVEVCPVSAPEPYLQVGTRIRIDHSVLVSHSVLRLQYTCPCDSLHSPPSVVDGDSMGLPQGSEVLVGSLWVDGMEHHRLPDSCGLHCVDLHFDLTSEVRLISPRFRTVRFLIYVDKKPD